MRILRTRRDWMKHFALAIGGSLAGLPLRGQPAAKSEAFVPIRPLTLGPRYHWFGYYDKRQFDPGNRYVLSNEVGFEHRSPATQDVIVVGMVDITDGDKWIPLGESRAWGWQQGCMLQWIPETPLSLIWNDREDKSFVSRVLDVKTGKRRTLPRPVYALSPNGKWAISADFARIQHLRPGYGYQGVADPVAGQTAPKSSGIWRIDLWTGESVLIISLAQLAAIPHQGRDLSSFIHYVNHLLVNTDGTRITFLHRWRERWDDDPAKRASGGFVTRMFTARPDGSDLFLLDPSGSTSHFIWRDPYSICAWTKPKGQPDGFYLLEDHTGRTEPVGKGIMTVNGHNTYLPHTDNAWILSDRYPDESRRQTVYLFHQPSGKRVDLGHFYSPPEYKGEWRCDTHPRSSNDGRWVTIDSPHGGDGRQIWLLDVRGIIA